MKRRHSDLGKSDGAERTAGVPAVGSCNFLRRDVTLLKNYLGPTLKKDGLERQKKIHRLGSQPHFDGSLCVRLLDDTLSREYVWRASAYHWYVEDAL